MDEYRHYVSGFFANRDDVEGAAVKLVQRGVPRERLQIFETDSATSAPVPKADSNAVLKDVLVDGTIGTAVGAGLGALAEVALVAANVSLFVASPLLAPLVMLGWGASIGGLLGATAGAVTSPAPDAGTKDGWLSALVRDAIASGQIVLVVQARTEQETVIARDVIQASVGDYKEIGTA
ncbi:hypothetical protein [Rhodoferax sp. UBA5149]|uniref:hypothetical protein n=1 Tax=Rhodoferax sp. UBA5149 TaxID=1947379 RepID=UPI0025D40289|nr:hypothetical protein [Rhodoferax sp. UBA5149]